MNNDPLNENKLNITPDQLWNIKGIIQQLVMVALMAIVYMVIIIYTGHSPGLHSGLESWLQNLHALFYTDTLFRDVLIAPVMGVAIAGFLFLLDTAVGYIRKENISNWIHRADYMLPGNKIERNWALGIAIMGSAVEEIMFRGFIFIAIVPIWTSWIWSALLLSAGFSLLHAGIQGFWSTLWIFIISLLLCCFIILGSSIYFVILLHMAINITNMFILPYFLNSKL